MPPHIQAANLLNCGGIKILPMAIIDNSLKYLKIMPQRKHFGMVKPLPLDI